MVCSPCLEGEGLTMGNHHCPDFCPHHWPQYCPHHWPQYCLHHCPHHYCHSAPLLISLWSSALSSHCGCQWIKKKKKRNQQSNESPGMKCCLQCLKIPRNVLCSSTVFPLEFPMSKIPHSDFLLQTYGQWEKKTFPVWMTHPQTIPLLPRLLFLTQWSLASAAARHVTSGNWGSECETLKCAHTHTHTDAVVCWSKTTTDSHSPQCQSAGGVCHEPQRAECLSQEVQVENKTFEKYSGARVKKKLQKMSGLLCKHVWARLEKNPHSTGLKQVQTLVHDHDTHRLSSSHSRKLHYHAKKIPTFQNGLIVCVRQIVTDLNLWEF